MNLTFVITPYGERDSNVKFNPLVRPVMTTVDININLHFYG